MKTLESLKAWRVAEDVSYSAYRATMQENIRRHEELARQIRRAAISIPANIAEGYALGTRAQLIRCLRISYGSASELVTHIELARRLGIISNEVSQDLLEQSDGLLSLLVGLLKHLGARVGPRR